VNTLSQIKKIIIILGLIQELVKDTIMYFGYLAYGVHHMVPTIHL